MKPKFKYISQLVFAASLIILISGCNTLQPGSVGTIADAQLAFNRASMTYNQWKLIELQQKKPEEINLEELRVSTRADYELANALVEKVIAEEKKKQAQTPDAPADRLYASALVLRALSLLKLAVFESTPTGYMTAYQTAITAAAEAEKVVGDQERDKTIMKSMKALANSDLAAKLMALRLQQNLRDFSLDCDQNSTTAAYGCIRTAILASIELLDKHLTDQGDFEAPDRMKPFLATYLATSLNSWFKLISTRPLGTSAPANDQEIRAADIEQYNSALAFLQELALENGNPKPRYEVASKTLSELAPL